jgi:predicted ribosomally synthesized peptide with SipW-like signal peptide
MSKTKTKRYLVLLAAVGLVAAALGGTGTFASFNAEVTNSGNTFATGNLLLSDSVFGGNVCYSDTSTTNSETASCSAIVNTTNLTTNHTSSNSLTITNTGSLASTNLKLFGGSCVNTNVGTFDPGSLLTRTGDVCGSLLISVEKDASVGGSAVSCVVSSTPAAGACDPTAGVALSTFLSAHSSAATSFDLGDSLAPSAALVYKVYLRLPDENNTFQGRSASFSLTWHVDQA